MKLDDLFVASDSTLAEALQQLDLTARGILFVIEGDGLVGTLTDGDIRRALIANGRLDVAVSDACNRKCVSLPLSDRNQAQSLIRELSITAVPILDGDGRVVDCVFREGDSLRRQTRTSIDLPVVIMAGGKGTRLYPYTKVLPKPLIPVNDVPIIERVINSFRMQGCSDFHLVVNHQHQIIEAYFAGIEHDYEINFVEEGEFLGTGGGLRLARDFLDATFVLTNCDILVSFDLADALAQHRAAKNAATMIASLKNYEIPYGTVELDAGGSIASMAEKPTVPFLVNTGCYIVEPTIVDLIEENESIGFPDLIYRCMDHGMHAGVYPISEKSWLDMGQFDEFERMSNMLG